MQPNTDRNKRKKKKKVKSTDQAPPMPSTITPIAMPDIPLPEPTVPQPFQPNDWEYVKSIRQKRTPKKYSLHARHNKPDKKVKVDIFTYRDLTKKKHNYRQMKRTQTEKVEKAEHQEYVKLTDTVKCFVWNIDKMDPNGQCTYYNPQAEDKIDQDGEELFSIRGTGGGDGLHSEFDNVARSTNSILVKTFLNAAVSERAHIVTLDIKQFFVNFDLPENEKVYLKIMRDQIPQQTVDLYSIKFKRNKKGKEYTIVQCKKALYGLPQSNYIAYQGLKNYLAEHDFYETSTKCLFRHKTKNIMFMVHVDDFAIKIQHIKDAEYLVNILEKKFQKN